MPSRRFQTSIGGSDEIFKTTCWSEIQEVQKEKSDKQQAVINELCRRYWKPVYCYLRRKGSDNETAKDLTQGFFCEIVLGRDLVQRADPEKGRFRTYLLTALIHYVANINRYEKTKKRFPQNGLVQWDQEEFLHKLGPVDKMTPDQAFNYIWASELLDRVITKVEQNCIKNNLILHWKIFQEYFLLPILNRTKPPKIKEICQKLGIENKDNKAYNMKITVERRFRSALKEELIPLLTNEEELDLEIQDLIKTFSQNSAK